MEVVSVSAPVGVGEVLGGPQSTVTPPTFPSDHAPSYPTERPPSYHNDLPPAAHYQRDQLG